MILHTRVRLCARTLPEVFVTQFNDRRHSPITVCDYAVYLVYDGFVIEDSHCSLTHNAYAFCSMLCVIQSHTYGNINNL